VEWEDTGLDRYRGAPEALEMIRMEEFAPYEVAFDAAFSSK